MKETPSEQKARIEGEVARFAPDPVARAEEAEAMRTCVRCGEDTHMSATEQPHMCADKAKRLARRERQVFFVERILAEKAWAIEEGRTREVAEAIVARLMNMGVGND